MHRLLTQIRRLENRSGRRAAGISVAVPPNIDPARVEEALSEHFDAEVQATHDPTAVLCRVTTVEFELHDEITAASADSQGGVE